MLMGWGLDPESPWGVESCGTYHLEAERNVEGLTFGNRGLTCGGSSAPTVSSIVAGCVYSCCGEPLTLLGCLVYVSNSARKATRRSAMSVTEMPRGMASNEPKRSSRHLTFAAMALDCSCRSGTIRPRMSKRCFGGWHGEHPPSSINHPVERRHTVFAP